VKGNIKTQVLVVKEGAHWEGGVTMTREPGARPAPTPGQPAAAAAPSGQKPSGSSGASIFSKGEREGGGDKAAAEPREGQPAGQGGGGGQ
jgi:hypothetical protein